MFHFDVTLKHLPGHGIWHLTVKMICWHLCQFFFFCNFCDGASMAPLVMKRKIHLVACWLDLVGRVIMLYLNNSCGPLYVLHASWLGMHYILASFSSSTLDSW